MARWLKIALGLSLALNVFFLGLTGGSLFQGKPERRGDAPNSFLATLSDERKTEVKAYFAKMREDRKSSREDTRAKWQQVREAMTATPYDRAALEAAMDAVMESRTDRRRTRNASMIEFVSSMTDAERQAFSDAMRERWQRRRDRRRQREGN
jgi:Spy/CpxP family protein refolding chaperone